MDHDALMPLILSEDLAASRAPTGNVYICICAGQDITSIGSFAIWCEVNIWPLLCISIPCECRPEGSVGKKKKCSEDTR